MSAARIRTDRRLMQGLAGAMAAAAAGGLSIAAAAPGADAALIRQCAEFEAVERKMRSFWGPEGSNPIEDDDERDIVQEPLHVRQEQVLSPIVDATASTMDDIKARLNMIMTYHPKILDRPDDWGDAMIRRLLLDMKAVML